MAAPDTERDHIVLQPQFLAKEFATRRKGSEKTGQKLPESYLKLANFEDF